MNECYSLQLKHIFNVSHKSFNGLCHFVCIFEIFELNLKQLMKLSIQNTVLSPYGQAATAYKRITTGLINHLQTANVRVLPTCYMYCSRHSAIGYYLQ